MPHHPNPDSTPSRALIALLLIVPFPSLGTAAAMLWWPESPAGKLLFVAAKLWVLLLPLVWTLAIDRKPLSWSPPHHGGFATAILTGLLIAAFIVTAYAFTLHVQWLDTTSLTERAARTGLDRPSLYLAGAFYWITLNSLMEEYLWRWFVFRKFEILLGSHPALIAAALAFTAHHIIALAAQFDALITTLASIGVFIGGATWSWLYLRYRSVWPSYVSHAIVDLPIFVIGWHLIFNTNP
jgi:uncharacterized protein